MEQKRVSFAVAKAIKEAGYNEPCDMYYHIYDDEYDSETSLEMTGDGCSDFINSLNRYRCAAPTYLSVWLWLWRKKKISIMIAQNKDDFWEADVMYGKTYIVKSDPEEAIIGAIEYLVTNNLIK